MSYWPILDKNRSRFAEWRAIASSPGHNLHPRRIGPNGLLVYCRDIRGAVVPFGLGMATYAQRKIDRMVVGHGGKQ